jgi:hypothetical protein
MNYTPFTNYKTVSINRGLTTSGTTLYTNNRDSFICFVGSIGFTGTESSGMITVGNSESRILFSSLPVAIDNNDKEAATYGGRGLIFVAAGEPVSYTNTGDANTSAINGTLRVLDLD